MVDADIAKEEISPKPRPRYHILTETKQKKTAHYAINVLITG